MAGMTDMICIGGPRHGQRVAVVDNARYFRVAVADFASLRYVGDHSSDGTVSIFVYRREMLRNGQHSVYEFWVPDDVQPEDVPAYLLKMASSPGARIS